MLVFAINVAVSFFITVILGAKLIPVLKSIKMGQKILEIGPRWHKSKEGTPTMGGLFFIAAFSFSMLTFGIFTAIKSEKIALLGVNCVFVALCALTGFIDDYVKFFKKQNEGLTPIQKLIFQFVSAGLYLVGMKVCGVLSTQVHLPFVNLRLELSFFFYIIAILGIVYMVNAVNLTDGIDGLCSSVTLVVMIALAFLAKRNGNAVVFQMCAAIIGGILGFLYYNFYPAKVFMGDTGSLFLGGILVACCFSLGYPVLVVIAGVVYLAEALSVVLQVLSFKLTGKRIFKMSPIHHHFEMCGWSEIKIVAVFSFVALVFSFIGVVGYSIV